MYTFQKYKKKVSNKNSAQKPCSLHMHHSLDVTHLDAARGII